MQCRLSIFGSVTGFFLEDCSKIFRQTKCLAEDMSSHDRNYIAKAIVITQLSESKNACHPGKSKLRHANPRQMMSAKAGSRNQGIKAGM
jgi:hypothetical protein